MRFERGIMRRSRFRFLVLLGLLVIHRQRDSAASTASSTGSLQRGDRPHTGTPVNLTYDVPSKVTGKIDKVTINLKPIQITSR
jgi:hypothetical protein